MEVLTAAILGMGVSFGWGWLAVREGPGWGFIDEPDGSLKTHQATAVPLGGVGLLAATLLGLAVTRRFDPFLAAGAVLLVGVGVIDDRWGLPPVARLVAATGAGLLMAGGRPDWQGLILVGLVVVCVNAVNLFDGLDTLAGGTALVSFLGLALLALVRDAPGATVATIAGAALAGFLVWNRPPARMFLGDNGAYLIGGLLAYTAVVISDGLVELVVATALVGAPLFDLAVTILRRLVARRPLFTGDRDHTYDRLSKRGWPVGRTSLIFALAQTLWVGLVIAVEMFLLSLPSVFGA